VQDEALLGQNTWKRIRRYLNTFYQIEESVVVSSGGVASDLQFPVALITDVTPN
jgi:hypothetical protein